MSLPITPLLAFAYTYILILLAKVNICKFQCKFFIILGFVYCTVRENIFGAPKMRNNVGV